MQLTISSLYPKAGRNPRLHFDAEAMRELEASIREHGLLQPILARPLDETRYEIVAGERRWRACKAVFGEDGMIEVSVRPMTDDEAEIAASVENLQREDLSPAEEAQDMQRLVLKYKGDKEEVCRLLGCSRSLLDRRLALMACTPAVLEALTFSQILIGATANQLDRQADLLNDARNLLIDLEAAIVEQSLRTRVAELIDELGEEIQA